MFQPPKLEDSNPSEIVTHQSATGSYIFIKCLVAGTEPSSKNSVLHGSQSFCVLSNYFLASIMCLEENPWIPFTQEFFRKHFTELNVPYETRGNGGGKGDWVDVVLLWGGTTNMDVENAYSHHKCYTAGWDLNNRLGWHVMRLNEPAGHSSTV